jgi:lipopolysaccharide export LptBFGC system permease protein LptF
MTFEWTSPLFIGIMSLALAPKQRRAGKRRMFLLMVILGWFLVVVGAAELLWQILTILARKG